MATAGATTAGPATGGAALPFWIASGCILGHLGLSLKSGTADDKGGQATTAALNLLRKRSKNAEKELGALGFQVSYNAQELHKRFTQLDGLIRLHSAKDDEILEYLQRHDELYRSLVGFLEARFNDLRGVVSTLPESIDELRQSMNDLHGVLLPIHTAVDRAGLDTEVAKEVVAREDNPIQNARTPSRSWWARHHAHIYGFAGLVGVVGVGLTIWTFFFSAEVVPEKLDQQIVQLDRIEQMLTEHFTDKKTGKYPILETLPPELIEQARLLRERGNEEQRALAEIALRNHEEADSIIQRLKRDPLADSHRLLTLEGDNWYRAGQFDRAVEPYEQAFALRPGHFTTRNNLVIARAQAQSGDISAHCRRAIDVAEGTLNMFPRETHPIEWAMTQNNLGAAWGGLPTGDRAKNIEKAIACYEAAVTGFAMDAHASGLVLPVISVVRIALMIYSKNVDPIRWAGTQRNLGNAWRNLPSGDRVANLRKAIACYEAALTVYTKDAHPVAWAMTQKDLGNAWSDLPTGDRVENLRKGIAHYDAALTVYTKDAHPLDWAGTQNNLGAAWGELPTGGRIYSPSTNYPIIVHPPNIRKAFAYLDAALSVYTRDAHPVEWAMTKNNLGALWVHQCYDDRNQCIQKAIVYFEAALTVRTKKSRPVEWALTQYNLGFAYRNLITGNRTANISKAIEFLEAALTVFTKNTHPVEWAATQLQFGIALANLADVRVEERCKLLLRGIASAKGTLTIRTPVALPQERITTMHKLELMRERYESAGCVGQVPFDDIEPGG